MFKDHFEVKTRKFHCPGSNKGFVGDWNRGWDMMSTVSTSRNNRASSHPHDCNCASHSSNVVRPTSVDERIPSQSSWESAASAQNDPDAFTIQCDRSMLEDHSEVKTRKFHCPGSNKGFVVDWGRYWDMMSAISVTDYDFSSSYSQDSDSSLYTSDVVGPSTIDERVPSQTGWVFLVGAHDNSDFFTIQCHSSKTEDDLKVQTSESNAPRSNEGFIGYRRLVSIRFADLISSDTIFTNRCKFSITAEVVPFSSLVELSTIFIARVIWFSSVPVGVSLTSAV